MKLLLKEIKATEDFQYSESFINSLKKPGKATFIRFSNEMPGGEQVVLKKAIMVSQGSDGKYYTSIYKVGLYDKEVLNVPKTDGVEYWVEVDKHKLPPDKGPVIIGN